MSGKSHKAEAGITGECLSDNQLYRYIEKLATDEESREVQQHLDSCAKCFDGVVMLARNMHTPASETEQFEIARRRRLAPQDQVAKILDYVEAECAPADQKQAGVAVVRTIWESIKTALGYLSFGPSGAWRPIVAVASLVFLFLIGRPFYLDWRSATLTARGLSFLAEQRAITARDETRPVGGFKYEEFSRTRSEENQSMYAPARADLERALQLDGKNASAQHYLGTYYLLIENDWNKAQEQYALALAQDSTNAAVLNDLGAAAFRQGDYDGAAENFSRALKYEARLKEAQYNLATVYQRQGKKAEAAREWEKYLQLESDRDWIEVAKSRLELLRTNP
jgi:tetratricopeptide (TPR) repeat protein